MKTKPDSMKAIAVFRKGTFTIIVCATILIVGLMNVRCVYGQIWPVNFDGAPVLKPGQIETTLFFSGSYASYHSDINTKGYLPGIKIGFGIARSFDLKISYSRGMYKYSWGGDWSKWLDSKENNITISPKVSFLHGILAVKLPFTLTLYKNYQDKLKAWYAISPRFIVSLHYKQYVEFNMSPFFEYVIPGEGNDPVCFVGGNIGFAFSSNLQRWSVRPEAFLSYPIPNNNVISGQIIYGWGLAATFSFDAFTGKKASSENK